MQLQLHRDLQLQVVNLFSCLLILSMLNYCPQQILLDDILYSFIEVFELKVTSKEETIFTNILFFKILLQL